MFRSDAQNELHFAASDVQFINRKLGEMDEESAEKFNDRIDEIQSKIESIRDELTEIVNEMPGE